MAYRLKLGESMDSGIRRIAGEQIDRAVVHIEATVGDDAATSVHEARKCLKRTRALLRFARPLIDRAGYRQMTAVLRETGRALSGARDLDVLAQTLTGLQTKGALKPATSARLAKAVAAARAKTEALAVTADRRRELVAQLVALRDGLAEFEISATDDRLATAGMSKCMADCREAFAQAFSSEHSEAFHDWRKSIQLHWRQMQLVERAWPAYCEARIGEARAISALIGEDRDLGLLQEFAAAHALPKPMLREITQFVTNRQQGLRAEAKALGERLLAEGTGGFCRRLQHYWAAASALRQARKAGADSAHGQTRHSQREQAGT